MADREEWLSKPRGTYKLSDIVRDVTKPAIDKRGQLEGQLMTYWPMIVGEELAAQCTPTRVVRSKTQSLATVDVDITNGDPTALQHQEPQIIERIATFFGYRAVQRIKWRQVPMGDAPKKDEKSVASEKPATNIAPKRNHAGIKDESLNSALGALEQTLTEKNT